MLYDSFTENSREQVSRLWVRRPADREPALFPLLVDKSGYARWHRGACYARRAGHREFTVELVTGGSCRVTLDGRSYTVEEGAAYVLPPELSHSYTTGPGGILFKRYITLSATEPGLLLPLRSLAGRVVPADYPVLKGLFKRVTRELEGEADGIVLSTLAYRILLELQRSRAGAYPLQVEHALHYFHSNLNRNITAQELAADTGTSISHLNRLFTASLNSSPMKYFMKLRMKWAADLVENTEFSIKEISFRTGFDNPGYFSFRFKEHFGISPNHLRQGKTGTEKAVE